MDNCFSCMEWPRPTCVHEIGRWNFYSFLGPYMKQLRCMPWPRPTCGAVPKPLADRKAARNQSLDPSSRPSVSSKAAIASGPLRCGSRLIQD